METRPLSLKSMAGALSEGWSIANGTRCVSFAYAGLFTLIGAVILGFLLGKGFTPFVITAAGAFMLVGPAILAGFFGIASAHEAGLPKHPRNVLRGFAAASGAIWVLALISALLFMIFVTDAAILYSYMVGGAPVWLPDFIPTSENVKNFLLWGAVSGFVIALLLFSVTAFSVPLLCERRAGLVNAVVASVRVVFGNFPLAMLWAALLSTLIITSILLLPLLPLTLPWLAFASRALYRQVLP
jgi:uncharacterized membrane protein